MIKHFYRLFISLSFRTHLILMLLLLSLPAMALISYSGVQQRRDSVKEGITEAKMLVRGILTEQYNITGDAQQLVSALAQLPDVREHHVAATSAILADVMKLSRQYTNIVIADRSGQIWASALPFAGPKFPFQQNRSFINAVKTRRFSSGEYGVGRISGKPNIAFGYPIVDRRGNVDSVIMVSVDFGYLNELLLETGLPKGSSFTLTDHDGVIVYSNLNEGPPIGSRVDEEVFRRMKQPADDSDIRGDGMIPSFGQLRLRWEKSPYLYVKAGIPVHETLVKARRAQLTKVAVLSPILVLAVSLAIVLAKFCFVNRIRSLQEAAQRLARGELDSRVSDLVMGGELGELGRSFDEMAQKLAARELELVRSQAELNDLYNNAPCGYHSENAEGVIVRINDTELNLLGYPRDDVIGKKTFSDLLHPKELPSFQENFRLLKEKGEVRHLEYELLRSDGTAIPVLLSATAICAADGTFLMSRSTIHDITDLKRAERKLNELNLSLAHRVVEETDRRLQHERLLARHARLAAIGEMIAAIAHQWRQPLATLGAVIQSLRMAWDRRVLDGAFLERAESDAQKQLYYMSDTIEDFRNFFSPEKVVESFELREKIHEVSLLVAAQFANSGVSLAIVDDAEGCVLRIRGYQNEFKQSVLNLVSNAFDAVVARWGRGKGRDAGGAVVISLGRDPAADAVVIEVSDNGCGIPAEIAEKIWEPYFTSKADGKGTGIGLYMAKLIIEESMGGSLAFRSLAEGTIFRIALPREEAEGEGEAGQGRHIRSGEGMPGAGQRSLKDEQ